MNIKRGCRLLIAFVIFFLTVANNYSFADDEKLVTKNLNYGGHSFFGDNISFYCNTGEKIETEEYTTEAQVVINGNEYNLPTCLTNYRDDIWFKVTYSQKDYKVYDCKVINRNTDEIIEDLSEENLSKLFDFEYGKNINEKEWVDSIKLSELKENEVYKFTAKTRGRIPEIENDTGECCLISVKLSGKYRYSNAFDYFKSTAVYKEIGGFNEDNFSWDNEYVTENESFIIMYKKIDVDEFIKRVGQNNIKFLSNYNDGQEIDEFGSNDYYIYNDTNETVTVESAQYTVVLEKGEICGCNSFYTVTLSYSKEEQNEKQEDEQKEKLEEKTNEQNEKQDNSKAQTKLPQTGKPIIMMSIVILSISIIIGVVLYKKHYN